jgi:Na+-driven multidrug efflux pump
VVLFVVIMLFGRQLVHLFISSDTDPTLYNSITEYAQSYMLVYFGFIFIYNIGHVYSEILRSVGTIRITVIAAFVGVVVRVVSAYALAEFMGEASLYWGIPLYWLTYYLIPIIYFFSGRWLPHYRAVHESHHLLHETLSSNG